MLLTYFNRKEYLRHRAVSLRQHGFLVLSLLLLVWRHHCVGQGSQLFWHVSFIINVMVDGRQVGHSTSRMSHVFKAAHPSPSRRSLPSSANSVPTVCGWSVCTGWHRYTQRHTRQTPRQMESWRRLAWDDCTVAESFGYQSLVNTTFTARLTDQ